MEIVSEGDRKGRRLPLRPRRSAWLQRLRQEPRLRQVPVVLFSSADEWTLRGSEIGAAVRRLLRKAPRRVA